MDHEPKSGSKKFRCPHCRVVAQQTWLSNYLLSSMVSGIYNHIYLNYRNNVTDYQQETIRKYLNNAEAQFPVEFNSLLARDLSIATCDDYSGEIGHLYQMKSAIGSGGNKAS